MPSLVLDANGTPFTAGDSCLFPIEIQLPQKPAGIIGGVWETGATFDNRSPALYYRIRCLCIKVTGMSCPENIKLYVGNIRPDVGEGPWDVEFTGENTDRNYDSCIWAETPKPSDDQKRWDQFWIEFYTVTTPYTPSP